MQVEKKKRTNKERKFAVFIEQNTILSTEVRTKLPQITPYKPLQALQSVLPFFLYSEDVPQNPR